MNKNIIIPNVCITIDIHGYTNIPIIIRDKDKILDMLHITKNTTLGNYGIRKQVINLLDNIIQIYHPDTLIMETNKLFIDKIDRHPDPLVYRNILLGFGIQTSIEDRYYNDIKYILSFPNYEWKSHVLNSSVKYSIDLYKSHINNQIFSEKQLIKIKENNYYKALCLSETMWFDILMNKKYQINKGD